MNKIEIVIIAVVFLIVIASIVVGIFFIVKHKKSENSNSNGESEKLIGNGIYADEDMTVFNFTKDIFPIISCAIFDNPIIAKYNEIYKSFVSKTEKEYSFETVDILNKLTYCHVIFNKFIEQLDKKATTTKLRRLKELYFKTVSKDISFEHCKEYIEILKSIESKTYEKIDIVNRINNLIEHKTNIFVDENSVKKWCNTYLKNKSNASWNRLMTAFKKTNLHKIIENSKNLVSTEGIDSTEFCEIIGMSRDEYIELAKELFGDSIKLVGEGELYQATFDMSFKVSAIRKKSSLFSNNDDIRKWIDINKDVYKEFATKVGENADEYADVVPNAVISVYTQILILLAATKDIANASVKTDFTKLFRFLEATRLNMVFINILANVLEESTFNKQLSCSFATSDY